MPAKSDRSPMQLASRVSGGHTARVTPVPIPNTEVKPRRADDTARATVWERRSPPGLNYKRPLGAIRAAFLFAFCLLRPEDGISGPHWPGGRGRKSTID